MQGEWVLSLFHQDLSNGKALIHFLTGKPALYTEVLVLMFLFTYLIFMLYDCCVEQ
jgi:hypothetical protein